MTALAEAPVDQPLTYAMHELAGYDKTKMDAWNASFRGRTAFKYFGFAAVGVAGLVLLSYVFAGITALPGSGPAPVRSWPQGSVDRLNHVTEQSSPLPIPWEESPMRAELSILIAVVDQAIDRVPSFGTIVAWSLVGNRGVHRAALAADGTASRPEEASAGRPGTAGRSWSIWEPC